MKNSRLKSLLLNYYPAEAEEKRFKDQMLEFIQTHDACFERSLLAGHITASCWLLNQGGTHALLLHHRKLDRWFQLGGHCDGDPNVLAVAIKEAQEESGIFGIQAVTGDIFDIDIHLIPENSKERAHLHYDVRFLLQVNSEEEPSKNIESKQLKWVGKNPDDLPTNSLSILRMHQKWTSQLHHQNHPL